MHIPSGPAPTLQERREEQLGEGVVELVLEADGGVSPLPRQSRRRAWGGTEHVEAHERGMLCHLPAPAQSRPRGYRVGAAVVVLQQHAVARLLKVVPQTLLPGLARDIECGTEVAS